jgi:hypothetical protein
MQGSDKGSGILVGNRGPLCDRDDTRSSSHPSVVALGCLNKETRGARNRVAT